MGVRRPRRYGARPRSVGGVRPPSARSGRPGRGGAVAGVLAGAGGRRRPARGGCCQCCGRHYGIHRDIGDPFDIGIDVFRFARLRAAQGDWETAARLASAADARLEEIGASLRGYDPPWSRTLAGSDRERSSARRHSPENGGRAPRSPSTRQSRSPSRSTSPMRSDLPSGTVTFLFTDVEGSTRLAARTRRRGLRRGARRAPATDPRGLLLARRRGGRHPGRCVLLRLSNGAGRARSGARVDASTRLRSDPRSRRPAHGNASRH